MRVLYWVKNVVAEISGGHLVQFRQTMQHVQNLGVDAQFTVERPADLSGIDIVHGYSLSANDIRFCKQRKVPVVLSTIYCSRRYVYPDRGPGLISQASRTAARARLGLSMFLHAMRGEHKKISKSLLSDEYERRAAYEMADLLLPNAHGEAMLVAEELGTTTPQKVVVNAADHQLFADDSKPDPDLRKYILCCARFEPHKNQLALIQAVNALRLPLKLVGSVHRDHAKYFAACQTAARASNNVEIIGEVAHEKLPQLYRGARVHAMPSFFETTGLASLEAALSGCNIVQGDRGYAREYFGDDIWWCDPYRVDSIQQAIQKAYESPFEERLRKRILEQFTWEQTARQTVDGYLSVINQDVDARSYSYDKKLAALMRV